MGEVTAKPHRGPPAFSCEILAAWGVGLVALGAFVVVPSRPRGAAGVVPRPVAGPATTVSPWMGSESVAIGARHARGNLAAGPGRPASTARDALRRPTSRSGLRYAISTGDVAPGEAAVASGGMTQVQSYSSMMSGPGRRGPEIGAAQDRGLEPPASAPK